MKMQMKMKSCVLLVLVLASVFRASPVPTSTEQQRDMSGQWFVHAVSTEPCLVPAAMPFVQMMSFVVDLTFKEEPSVYNSAFTVKILGFCLPKSLFEKNPPVFIQNSTLPQQTVKEGFKLVNVVPQSFCSDCVVVWTVWDQKMLFLLSRQQSVTVSDLRNFQILASGLNLMSPILLDQNYDFSNCQNPGAFGFDSPDIVRLKKTADKFTTAMKTCAAA